uniref:Glycosyl transferase family protein n=1 Tax=uncultured Chloroflexota bacterium TaxID=166587 RepID=H5SDZ9_9CHLR|nr:glycosyl transferase family protein [uncultured Chloroflexota bacterium]
MTFMHVLLIHQSFASLDEAGGTRHYELARLLIRAGHRVTVITGTVNYLSGQVESEPAVHQEDGLTICRVPLYSAYHRSFFHRLLSFFSFTWSAFWAGMRVKGVDIVWGTSPPIFQGVTAWALARWKRVPFLFEVRDLWPRFAIAMGVIRHPCIIAASEALERFLYRQADQVVVNSPGFLEHVQGRGARRVALIPNGADPLMFQANATGQDLRHRYHLEGKTIVLYAGAHGPANDLDVVLEAARLLEGSPIHFLLIGDGKDKPRLQQKAKEWGLNNVTFLPPAPKREIPAFLQMADIGLAILKPLEEYKTTYPNKVFDYMAAGKPILLAIDGVIRAVVEEAGCGIFVSPGDARALAQAARQLAADPSLQQAMGGRGRAYLEEHFSRQVLGEQFRQLLERMLEEKESCRQ